MTNKEFDKKLFTIQKEELLSWLHLESDLPDFLESNVRTVFDRLEKLEKVVDILKDKIEFEDLGEMQSGNVYRGYFNDCLDDEEVNSIKEVFNNEW